MKKIKRIIPLVVLALLSVFLLTSCDQMLKSIYKLDANNNQITVNVAMDTYTHPDYYLHQMVVNLAGTSTAKLSAYYDYTYYGYAYYTVTFSGLADGVYTIDTFWDVLDTGTYGGGSAPYETWFYDANNSYTNSVSMPWNGTSTARRSTSTFTDLASRSEKKRPFRGAFFRITARQRPVPPVPLLPRGARA